MPPYARSGSRSRIRALFAALVMVSACLPATPPPPPSTPPPVEAPTPPAPPEAALPSPPPALPREFRAVWVATVGNMDWPSRRGLPAEQQRAELLRILDDAAALGLNAVIFQVRPAADALYASPHEPWSEYLSGTMGAPPQPEYDPLEFAIREAHLRGLELHAWFNPYRARHPSGRSPASADHLSRRRPDLVERYGSHMWMDPGNSEVQDETVKVVLDVVQRYDIDGVHIDDYFYPYQERTAAGRVIPFPDDDSYARYRASGGRLARDDWRRDNVNTLIARLYREIKETKRWVKFGISPFGIWRPGYPASVTGLDAYATLYADARKWLADGWVDYFTPQLYWRIDAPEQSYPGLLDWWVEQNTFDRHVWPGNFIDRVADSRRWPAHEIVAQIEATRANPGAGGNVLFSMKTLLRNPDALWEKLRGGPYADAALVPASPWLGETRPAAPAVQARWTNDEAVEVRIVPRGEEPVRWWALQTLENGRWRLRVISGEMESVLLPTADWVAVRGIGRTGIESDVQIERIEG
ncbi:MAG TPA: family 10 glycosylhydrolase [Longimicrobiaceae bacterium]